MWCCLSSHEKRRKCYLQGCQQEAVAIIAAALAAEAETADLERERSGGWWVTGML